MHGHMNVENQTDVLIQVTDAVFRNITIWK